MLLRQFGELPSVQDAKHRTTVREQKGDLCDVDWTRRYIINIVFHERLRNASLACIEIDKQWCYVLWLVCYARQDNP